MDATTPLPAKPARLLRLSEVMERVGLGKSAIYARIRAKSFPRHVDLGGLSGRAGEARCWLERAQDRVRHRRRALPGMRAG